MEKIIKFELTANIEFIPLCDLLKITGVVMSGGEAKGIITEGSVKVDGLIEYQKRKKIRTGQKIEYKNININII